MEKSPDVSLEVASAKTPEAIRREADSDEIFIAPLGWVKDYLGRIAVFRP